MLVASIDVGIINLAVVFARIADDFTVESIERVENVNTTHFEHDLVPYDDCTLGHTKTTTDRLSHFVQERAPWFDACEVVLIERQPIMGHTDVEQCLFMLFRDKAHLVSPNAMHKHFNINYLTYEWRKVKTVEIADTMLGHHPEYLGLERRHDIADALCLLLYWLHTTRVAADRKVGGEADAAPPGTTSAAEVDEALDPAAVEAFSAKMQAFAYKPATNKILK
jgi:hypothetical protein